MKKHIILGVTGGIACYKMLDVASKLRKLGYEMNTIMTQNACEFVAPLSFETITNNYVVTDTFARPHKWEVEHIALAKKAELMLIAPATANIIGKVAHGIADDMLSTTVMAARCPVVFAPAMNTAMYENPIVQENIAYLKEKGYLFIEPDKGWLACGDLGAGKLPAPEVLVDYVTELLENRSDLGSEAEQDLKDKHVLITAGPTIEAIDPMRYITNHSSGKMGYAIAKDAVSRGAKVILVSGVTQLECPEGVERVNVKSARDMYEAVHQHFEWADVVIKTAAVADYRSKAISEHKIKKDNSHLTLELVPNPDILQSLGEKKTHQVLVGFAAETQNVLEYAKEKITKKHLDFIVANNIAEDGAGFKGDTNIATIIESSGAVTAYEQMSKLQLGHVILDKVKAYL
ncbi:bifunctional phosphopantothenoylcysteine decarboxylase/phosphopantothenate--cysteine ligase CoaBC [Cellulosilyticum lentocellum]|uniref:Coenzyme A biosynthesis bifunctional protein CoaBC n=1 Tax=Cellulosilyticum lentocellum (strain ATCC 49066 / DSM 5427 / NCIMB 11756 / RHM5) TaxID=642492 RepID=F2JR87_CELLD|nr:bifunctional phosphopantothenoylcysteine decarboxylase/phosphopantothenate--cysteine ligase CoaBC [Cellulosilyticum lentocellum]ADZ85068.1 phosphopantothenoylcysteine decarboxylase/phosphopantothenate/cysteine ligase [Cellulosilyticum lentocellum DSM 5427]